MAAIIAMAFLGCNYFRLFFSIFYLFGQSVAMLYKISEKDECFSSKKTSMTLFGKEIRYTYPLKKFAIRNELGFCLFQSQSSVVNIEKRYA